MTVEVFAEPEAHAFDLFVVHAAPDTDFVRGYLLPALNLPSARVLLMDELPLGGVVVAEIDRGVSRSRFTVAVLSPAYLADRWVAFGEQLASHLSARDVRVIPLRLTDCELPLRLDARVSLDFRDPAHWESEAARLRDLLHTAEPAAEHLACPYPGMRPFAEKDASRFFGRDPEIDDLIGRLDRGEREIYVIGPSGSGKSSLVQAGLLHVLDTGSSRLERSFVVRTMRPGERPADRLAKLLEGDLATPTAMLTATMAATPAATPAAMIEAFVARHPPAERVLVFVDQLEELFTLACQRGRATTVHRDAAHVAFGATVLPVACAARRFLRSAPGQRAGTRPRPPHLTARRRAVAGRSARAGDQRASPAGGGAPGGAPVRPTDRRRRR